MYGHSNHITQHWEVVPSGKDYTNCPIWNKFGLKTHTKNQYVTLTGGHDGAGVGLVGHKLGWETFEFRHCE